MFPLFYSYNACYITWSNAISTEGYCLKYVDPLKMVMFLVSSLFFQWISSNYRSVVVCCWDYPPIGWSRSIVHLHALLHLKDMQAWFQMIKLRSDCRIKHYETPLSLLWPWFGCFHYHEGTPSHHPCWHFPWKPPWKKLWVPSWLWNPPIYEDNYLENHHDS